MSEQINILHLSDLHFGITRGKDVIQGNLYEYTQIIESFFDDFSKIDSEWMPNIIVITGDIGWQGIKDDYVKNNDNEYSCFESFLNELLQITNLDINDIVCCPGNHDKYISKNAPEFHALRDSSDEHLVGNSHWFENYSNYFSNKKMVPLTASEEEAKYLYGFRSIKGVMFCVLNSAWLCDYRSKEDDRYYLRIGKKLAEKIYASIKNVSDDKKKITVTLFHHPFVWLDSQEIEARTETLKGMIARNSDLILHGHNHNESLNEVNGCIVRETGPLFSDDLPEHYTPRCNIYKLYSENKKIQVGRYFFVPASENINRELHWRWEIEEGFSKPQALNARQSERELEEKLNEIIRSLKSLVDSKLDDNVENKEIEKALGKFIDLCDEEMSKEKIKEIQERQCALETFFTTITRILFGEKSSIKKDGVNIKRLVYFSDENDKE